MIVVVSRVEAVHKRRDELLAEFRRYLSYVHSEPGCTECEIAVAVPTPDLVQQYYDDDVFTALQRWDGAERFLSYRNSSRRKERLATMRHLIANVETRLLQHACYPELRLGGGI